MFHTLVRVASAVSAFICFAAASQNRNVNRHIEEINEDIKQNHPRKSTLPSGYYYSLIFAGILQLAVFIILMLIER